MTNNRFTRYSEFKAQFNIDLKNYAQDKVSGGNKGDYQQFLNELRYMLQSTRVDSKKVIEDLMRDNGLNCSLPGLCQVLTGLGIIIKIKDKGYHFNVLRIDGRLAEFLFEYNHFKQKILNNRNFEDEVREMFLHQFGKFEESITGVNTYQTKNIKIEEVEEDESEDTIPVTSLSFSDALQYLKEGNKIQREGWNGKGMHIFLEEHFEFLIPAGAFKGQKRKYEPVICMFTAQGTTQPGWLASQADILAEDWRVVE